MVAMEPVEVIAAPNLSIVRSTSTEKRAKMPAKPISEQAFIVGVERKKDPTVAESRATHDSRSAEASPPVVVSGGVVNDVEAEIEMKEAVATGSQVRRIDVNTPVPHQLTTFAQGLYDMDVELGRSDPVAARSPLKV